MRRTAPLARILAGLLAALIILPPVPAGAEPASEATAAVASDAAAALAASTLGARPTEAVALGITGTTSVALVEAATGQVLVAREADRRRPIASAIKLVTALAVTEHVPAGSLIITGDEVVGIEGSSFGLRPGERRTVEELLAGLLLRSGNDVARALAVAVAGSEDAFTALMAEELAALGIDARPASASGLEDGDALSALELATVARAALREPRLRALVGEPELQLPDGRVLENRNLFLADADGATGLKTGFTSAAGFTLVASAERGGRELVAVVLGAGSDRERRAVASRLIEHGFGGTRMVEATGAIELRTSAGPVRHSLVPTSVTVASDATLDVGWPSTLRPGQPLETVTLHGAGETIGSVAVERFDGREQRGATTLGRALVDGVYAAVRAGAIAAGAPPALR